ncbi:MAG: hypothetical protein M3396_08185 [Actinomycetota bacterium]|nr:hypothetical protein [Actinomycetota bacterium]MDQ3575615.1 hypothetical protein [Actinomycetota bacterium]
MAKPSSVRNLGAVVLVVAFPVAVAWVIGDLSTTDDPRPDYAIRPPDIPPAMEHALGAFSLVAVVASTAALVWAWRREPPRPGWLSVLVPLVVAGAIAGLGWRVMTAGVIGANIGAGLTVLFGTPVVIALIILACVSAWRRR